MYRTTDFTATISVAELISRFRDPGKFIAFCKKCGRYGRCWACPPYGFSTDAALSGYRTALLIATRITPDKTVQEVCTDPDNARLLGREMLARVREQLDPKLLVLETEYPGSRAFFAGTCFACPEDACTRIKGEPCVHPDKIRPSLEAFGFDIGKMASEALGIELKWSNDGRLPEYFTLVSALLSPAPINDVNSMSFHR